MARLRHASRRLSNSLDSLAKAECTAHAKADGLVKVRVDLARLPESDAWHDFVAETLWARPAERANHFRLYSSPFYAYGLAYDDLVEVRRHWWAGTHVLKEVVERGGHSNLRVYFLERATLAERASMLEALVALGCTYEGAGPVPLYAIDVPNDEPLREAVLDVMTAAKEDGLWEWDEGFLFGTQRQDDVARVETSRSMSEPDPA